MKMCTTAKVQELIRQYKVRDAFRAMADDLADNREMQTLFLQLLSFNNNVALLQPDSDMIRVQAESNPYMAYAYARLHDVLQPGKDSDRIKEKYYTMAADYGIGDAYAYLAFMYRDGDLGEQDTDTYGTLMRKAEQMGSGKARQQAVRDLVYGSNGSETDPLKAYELAEHCLKEPAMPDPAYYLLMAEADAQLGRKAEAVRNYRLAAENGCSAAFYWWAVTACCDEEGNVADRESFMEIMQKGIDVRAADCFLMYSLLLDDGSFEGLGDGDKAEVKEGLLSDLKTGWMLGDSVCALFLGDYYENGRYGFEEDYGNAWLWYSRGAVLHNPFCFEALARMILDDGTAPGSYDEEYGYECAYRGLLLGGEDLLEVVVRGYRNGFLTRHAAMIESKWLPGYEQGIDGYDDGHEYLYDGEPEREIEED